MNRWKWLYAMGAGLALLAAGCGGGGGGGEVDTKVRVNLTGADWAAYAASPWKEINVSSLPADGIFTFEPAADGRYSLAIHCNGGSQDVMLVHATRDELPYLDTVCEKSVPQQTFRVAGQVAGIGSGMTRITAHIDDQLGSNSGIDVEVLPYGLKEVPEGVFDLVVQEATLELERYKTKRFAIRRDITIDRNITDLDVNLTSEGIEAIEHNFTVTDGEGFAYFISANKTVVPYLGDGGPDGGAWYAFKNSTQQGDIYQFVAGSADKYSMRVIYECKDATTDPGDVTFDPGAITPMDAVVTREGNVSQLAYTPAAQSPELRAYYLTMEWSGGANREIWITKGWLGSETSYELDDPRTLPGWKTEWNDGPTETLEWEVAAVMANRSFSDAVESVVESSHAEMILFGIDMVVHWAQSNGTSGVK